MNGARDPLASAYLCSKGLLRKLGLELLHVDVLDLDVVEDVCEGGESHVLSGGDCRRRSRKKEGRPQFRLDAMELDCWWERIMGTDRIGFPRRCS
jgi:hypothetical protein